MPFTDLAHQVQGAVQGGIALEQLTIASKQCLQPKFWLLQVALMSYIYRYNAKLTTLLVLALR